MAQALEKLKADLKEWEKAFETTNGRKPKKLDIEAASMRWYLFPLSLTFAVPKYQSYQKLKAEVANSSPTVQIPARQSIFGTRSTLPTQRKTSSDVAAIRQNRVQNQQQGWSIIN